MTTNQMSVAKYAKATHSAAITRGRDGLKRGKIYAAAKNWLIPPGQSSDDVSALNTDRAERVAWLIVAGLALELVLLWFSDRSMGEKAGQTLADTLIVLGVAGELAFGLVARTAGNAAQAEARRATAEALQKAAEANEKAEQERLARVKIEARLAPRSMTADQQMALAERLRPYTGRRGQIIASPPAPESEMFARWLAAPLRAAGWDIEVGPGQLAPMVLFPHGVIVQWALQRNMDISTADSEPAIMLAEALDAFGIEASAFGVPLDPPNNIRVIISTK